MRNQAEVSAFTPAVMQGERTLVVLKGGWDSSHRSGHLSYSQGLVRNLHRLEAKEASRWRNPCAVCGPGGRGADAEGTQVVGTAEVKGSCARAEGRHGGCNARLAPSPLGDPLLVGSSPVCPLTV